jgi:hypothetical protein
LQLILKPGSGEANALPANVVNLTVPYEKTLEASPGSHIYLTQPKFTAGADKISIMEVATFQASYH